MVSLPQFLRIFLSSPGDVADERGLAVKVVDDLDHSAEFRNHFRLQPLRWDDPQVTLPQPINRNAQKSVDRYLIKPSQCDLVVVIFFSRLGTPVNMDGKDYLSGTHYEMSDAMRAGVETWVYLRTDEPPFKVKDSDFDLKYAEYKRLQDFIANLNPQGRFDQPYNPYLKPEDFRKLFENQLTIHLRHLRENGEHRSPVAIPALGERVRWQGSPFPGLRAFTPADAPIFFGRGRETDALLKRVSEQRFVAVVGASGSGKSSLVGAGLIPRLRDNALEGSKDWLLPEWVEDKDKGIRQWVRLRFTPGEVGDNPFLSLAIKLAPLIGMNSRELADDLLKNPAQLEAVCDQALAESPAGSEVLIFIDQFEELFTLVAEAYCSPFVTLLIQAAQASRLRTMVTMRSDFYYRCLEIPALAQLLEDGQFPLPAPTETLLDMIVRPAQRAGLDFEEALITRILEDTGYEPGSLALMAYALDELYQIAAEQRRDGRIMLTDYAALGGVQGAIGKRAETIFGKLDGSVKDTLPRVFRELVEVDERGTATRQRAPIQRFGDKTPARELIDAFTNGRLLTTSQGETGSIVEVAHEALFRSWERLRTWIVEAQEHLILLRQVKNAAKEWNERGRPDYLLWPDERLKLVKEMQQALKPELDPVVQEFIQPEQERLLREIEDIRTAHQRRAAIGDRLGLIGDGRPGVRVKSVSRQGQAAITIPDMVWCRVEAHPKKGGFLKREQWPTVEIEGQAFEVQPFYMARYLITHQQFQAFRDDREGFDDPRWWQGMPKEYQKQAVEAAKNQFENAPRDSVSWYQALAFARWLDFRYRALKQFEQFSVYGEGKVQSPTYQTITLNPDEWQIRLPTEWEWQWAAQNGEEGREYPWAGKWDDQPRANTSEAGISRRSMAVGMYPDGAAACGALDMAGNLFEWCLNDYEEVKQISLDIGENRVLRGGSFAYFQGYAPASYRHFNSPLDRFYGSGFRVVVSSPIQAI